MYSQLEQSTSYTGQGMSVRDSYTTEWSASTASEAYYTYPQAILEHYHYPSPETILEEPPTPSSSHSDAPSFHDSPSLEIDFDWSCLDGLDEKLLYHPMESWADACWEAAVEDNTDRSATPTQSHPGPQSRSPRYSDFSVGSTTYYGTDEDEDWQLARQKGLISGTSTPQIVISRSPPVIPPFEFNGDRTSFILFESYFAADPSYPSETAGSGSYAASNFSKHSSLPSRIISICSAFQGRIIQT